MTGAHGEFVASFSIGPIFGPIFGIRWRRDGHRENEKGDEAGCGTGLEKSKPFSPQRRLQK
jgi:hypothetical protein